MKRIVIVLNQGEVQEVLSDEKIEVQVVAKVFDDIERDYLKECDGEFFTIEKTKDSFVYANPTESTTILPEQLSGYWLACQKAFK